MALIKTLKDFLTKTVIYPTTKTNAVYDDTVGRLDTYLHNTLGAEPIDDVEEETAELRDADTLGGRYTAEDLDAMPHSTAIEDYANVEPPMNDADRLGGKYTKEDIEALIEENKKLNSNLAQNKKLSVRYGAYEVDVSLEQAILKHINDMQEYVPYFIHGVNISGLSISATNDVMIEVTRYGETGKRYNNWYRVMIYDNQSSGIFTITNVKGSWNGWKTIISAT